MLAAAQLPATEASPQVRNSPLGDFSPPANDNINGLSDLAPESWWGNDSMHARYYNPMLGRFLSVDPAGGQPNLPQSWNRYAYVMNRPLVMTDPTGRLGSTVVLLATFPLSRPNDSVDLTGFLDFLGWAYSRENAADMVIFFEILNRAMPGSQLREQAQFHAEQGDIVGEALFNSLADLFPESTGEAALAVLPVGRLKIAKKLRINASSETGAQLLDNLGLTVDEFTSKFRKASIRSELPSEFLDKTVFEALQSGGTKLRKLLTDGRFAK